MKWMIIISVFSLSLNAEEMGDPKRGKTMTATCAACHGTNGVSSNSEWPNLKGQQITYMVNQLKAFKSGERKNVLMNGVLDDLNEKDFLDISTYYNGIQ
tara:strand:- start:43369 stop:43665 length:297 start_codon:yes stop_codon:yes gene_type:complete